MYSSWYFLKYSDSSLEYFHVEIRIAYVGLHTRTFPSRPTRICYLSIFNKTMETSNHN